MKRSTLIALISLLVAVTGTVIALAAYLNHKKDKEYGDFDEDLFYDDEEDEIEYYATQIEQEECSCGCGCGCEEEKETTAETTTADDDVVKF